MGAGTDGEPGKFEKGVGDEGTVTPGCCRSGPAVRASAPGEEVALAAASRPAGGGAGGAEAGGREPTTGGTPEVVRAAEASDDGGGAAGGDDRGAGTPDGRAPPLMAVLSRGALFVVRGWSYLNGSETIPSNDMGGGADARLVSVAAGVAAGAAAAKPAVDGAGP